MKLLRLFIFLILISNIGNSQNSPKLDSLLKVLPTLGTDSLKVKTLNLIADNYNYFKPQTALKYAQEALELSEKITWTKGISNSNFTLGFANYNLGNYLIAIEYYQKCLAIRRELKDKKDIANVLGNIASTYFVMGNELKALEYNLEALKLREEIGNKKGISKSLINIGMIYKIQNNYEKALECYSKALKIAIETNDLDNQAIQYGCLGGLYWKKGDFNKSLENYFKALTIDEKLANKRNVAAWYANIAGVYSTEGDTAKNKGDAKLFQEKYNKTLEFSLKGLKISEELSDEGLTSHILGNIGAIYLSLGKYKESNEYLEKSIQIAKKINYTELIKENYFKLFELNKEIGNYKTAIDTYEKYIKLKDSISATENKNVIADLQIKYETEKKETEIKSLGQQNKILELSITNNKYLTIVLITIFVLILSVGFLVIRQNRLKSKQENIRLEQKLLRTQMNPHFIFNSLSGIESFIYEHQPKEAGNYLAQFARLMRLILENSASEYISLDKELETLNYYLSLQKLRLNDNLQYSIEVDPLIIPEQVFIPPMLAQPFIENSIEHGFRGLKEGGKVKVTFKLESNYLEIKIVDNGIGIVQAQQQKDLYKENKSMAMQITYERLKSLNKSKKQKLIFNVREISEENEKKGTEIIFTIPI